MDILKEARAQFDYLVKTRRQFHMYPELSGKEYETVKYICKELEEMGIEYVDVEDGGIVFFSGEFRIHVKLSSGLYKIVKLRSCLF